MIITCTECQTKFTLDEKLIKDDGSKVQCSSCSHTFTVYPPSSEIPTIQLTDVLQGEEGSAKLDGGTELAGETVSIDELAVETEPPEGMEPAGNAEDIDLSSILDTDDDLSLEIDDDDFDLDLEEERDPEPAVESDGDDLNLDFELDSASTTDGIPDPSSGEDGLGEIQDFDLTDLEELVALDQDSETAPQTEKATEDTDGQMDFEIDGAVAPDAADGEGELELNLDLDEDDDPETAPEIEPVDSTAPDEGAMELALDETESGEESEALDLDFSDDETEKEPIAFEDSERGEEGAPVFEEADTTSKPDYEDQPVAAIPQHLEGSSGGPVTSVAEKPKSARRKPVSAPLLVVLIIVMLGGAGYGSFMLLDRMGMEIPYLDKITPYIDKIPYIDRFRQPQVQDPGNLKMTPIKIQSRFVRNEKDGRLFVIQGQVRNDYPESRSFVRVTGKLYVKGKKQVKSKTIYGGNPLMPEEIAKLSMADIDKRLSARSGKDGINTKIKPGQPVPFVIVFDKLPDNLDEFTVEVVNSDLSK